LYPLSLPKKVKHFPQTEINETQLNLHPFCPNIGDAAGKIVTEVFRPLQIPFT
jgi:hypothetical protein